MCADILSWVSVVPHVYQLTEVFSLMASFDLPKKSSAETLKAIDHHPQSAALSSTQLIWRNLGVQKKLVALEGIDYC